jgi:hypothetical protein
MREERPVVQQGSMILPYFDDEVPVVSLADGTRYIPVVALCHMLGLCMFCGIWTVCSSTRETQASLHLQPGRFSSILAIGITCSTTARC